MGIVMVQDLNNYMKKDPYEKEFTKALRKEGKNVARALDKKKEISNEEKVNRYMTRTGYRGRNKF